MDYNEWWEQQGEEWKEAGPSTVRHAPTDNNYHVPDERQLARMGGGVAGRFATIPAANRDGTSKGFDASRAGPAQVDPQLPGSVIFDPSRITQRELEATIATSSDPFQVYARLGYRPTRQATASQLEQRVNDVVPAGTYIAPATNTNFHVGQSNPPASPLYLAQEEQHMQPVPPLPGNPAPHVATPLQQPGHPGQQQYPGQFYQQPTQPYLPPVPQPAQQSYDPNLSFMLGQIVTALGGLSQRVQAVEQRPADQPEAVVPDSPPPVATVPGGQRTRDSRFSHPGSRVPSMKDERRQPQQTVEEFKKAQDPRDGVITGFETLNLPFVTGPLPQKAKKQVYFDLPNAGRQSARYHEVIEAETCIILVYDTRFEDGYQYLPPELGEEGVITLHIPEFGDNRYYVGSVGLTFQFGVFDMVVLVKRSDAGVQ